MGWSSFTDTVPMATFAFFAVLSAGLLLNASFDVGLALLLAFVFGGLAVAVALWLAPTLIAALAGAFGAAAGFALTFAAAATSTDSDNGGVFGAGLLWGGAVFVAYSALVGLAFVSGLRRKWAH